MFESKNSTNGISEQHKCDSGSQLAGSSVSGWEYGTWLSFLVALLAFTRAEDTAAGAWLLLLESDCRSLFFTWTLVPEVWWFPSFILSVVELTLSQCQCQESIVNIQVSAPGPSQAHEAPRFNLSRHIPSKAATIASLSARD